MRKLIYGLLILGSALVLFACAMSHKSREMVPSISLAMPDDYQMAAYLGFSPPLKSSFKLTEIKARVIVAEVLQVRCPHCQSQVEDLKELYNLIRQEGLFHKVKIIGLAYGDNFLEVEQFGRYFSIPYPLFADPGREQVRVKEIPVTFILELTPVGARVLYEFHGLLPDAEELLKLIRRAGVL